MMRGFCPERAYVLMELCMEGVLSYIVPSFHYTPCREQEIGAMQHIPYYMYEANCLLRSNVIIGIK